MVRFAAAAVAKAAAISSPAGLQRLRSSAAASRAAAALRPLRAWTLTAAAPRQADDEPTKKRSFRKFTFRGVDLDQLLDLTTDELVQLFHARARRRCAARPSGGGAHARSGAPARRRGI